MATIPRVYNQSTWVHCASRLVGFSLTVRVRYRVCSILLWAMIRTIVVEMITTRVRAMTRTRVRAAVWCKRWAIVRAIVYTHRPVCFILTPQRSLCQETPVTSRVIRACCRDVTISALAVGLLPLQHVHLLILPITSTGSAAPTQRSVFTTSVLSHVTNLWNTRNRVNLRTSRNNHKCIAAGNLPGVKNKRVKTNKCCVKSKALDWLHRHQQNATKLCRILGVDKKNVHL